MNKRYQVFISSTFKDLEKERILLTQTLLRCGCFPAGMEWFPAIDEEQFEYIKQVIDDTDYYVIVLGGLYGSIAPDGKSYTEKEYEYAITKGKKVIALVQRNPINSETDDDRIIKFTKFRKRVTQSRLVSYWDTPEELASKFATSLERTMRNHPAQGWIRCDSDTCDVRLGFFDINSKIASLDIKQIKTIHIMASGTSSYIQIVSNLLRMNKNTKSRVHIYIYFRLGVDQDRINCCKQQYDSWWNKLKRDMYSNLKFHFICIKDFKVSFRGIVINKEIGLVGFYVRSNGETSGTLGKSIFVDKNTDSGKYIIDCFLECFKGQQEYPTLKSCIENSI